MTPRLDAAAKHFIGASTVYGLFAVIGLALVGVADIKNPTVALLLGQLFGLLMTPVLTVITDYFPRGKIERFGKESDS